MGNPPGHLTDTNGSAANPAVPAPFAAQKFIACTCINPLQLFSTFSGAYTPAPRLRRCRLEHAANLRSNPPTALNMARFAVSGWTGMY
jgi:hypothetical protein